MTNIKFSEMPTLEEVRELFRLIKVQRRRDWYYLIGFIVTTLGWTLTLGAAAVFFLGINVVIWVSATALLTGLVLMRIGRRGNGIINTQDKAEHQGEQNWLPEAEAPEIPRTFN